MDGHAERRQNQDADRSTEHRFVTLKSAIILFVIVAALLLLNLETKKYVDIDSGSLKTTRSVFGVEWEAERSETALSVVAGEFDARGRGPSIWRLYQSRSLLNPTSPHYRHHKTVYNIELFVEYYLDSLDEARQASELAQFLSVLRSDDPSKIDKYVEEKVGTLQEQ